MNTFINNQKGAAAVEFAFVLPILMVLVFGTIEFGVLFYNKAMITNASREGARSGIVFAPTRPTDTDISSVVDTYCATSLITFGTASSPATTVSRAGSDPGDSLTVNVTYHYDFLLLPNLIETLTPGLDITAQTIMRFE
jgi:Flp pilus assembly protein TadG